MKERWFNYRPICLVASFLLLGSLFAFYISANKVLTIICASTFAVALFALAIIKKKLKYFAIPLTAFIVGVFAYNVAIINFNKTIEYKPSSIQARISAVGKPNENYIKVEIDNCIFDNEESKDCAYVIIYDYSQQFSNIEIGRKISFKTNSFVKNDLFYNKTPNSKMLTNNLKYTAITQIDDINFMELDKTFAEEFRGRVKEGIELSLTESNTELAYSALFSDKVNLGEYQQTSFRSAGVSHLIAVSGLHVGIIVGVLSFLLKPLKKRKWTCFAIITSILLFYLYLCNFAVSVIRAVVMTIILLLSKILNEEYDIYNSISIAAIVIFLINPLCIFDVSFLMSFSCVLGIAMLYKPICVALTKLKIHKKIVSAMSVSISTTLALIIISAYYFQNFNAISVIANIIIIPLFTLAFIPTFIIAMLSSALPFLGYLLFPINYLFDLITYIAHAFGGLFIANFTTLSINYIAILVYFIFILLVGKLCTAKKQYKLAISLPVVAILFYCLI